MFHQGKQSVSSNENRLLPVSFFGVAIVCRCGFRPIAAEDFLNCGLFGGSERKLLAKESVVSCFPEMGYHVPPYAPRAIVGNVAQHVFYSPCKADFFHRAVMRALAAFLRIKLRV